VPHCRRRRSQQRPKCPWDIRLWQTSNSDGHNRAAASLWVSAAMLANGVVATIEDASPGGSDNPDGSSTQVATGSIAFKCAAMAVGLACLGLAIQFA
ncbi:hypothetical protein, partial [Roseateles saccharophilus]